MKERHHLISTIVAAIWLGSMSVIGFMAVPLLFRYLPSAAVAGNMAGQLFLAQGWVSIISIVLLLMVFRARLRDYAMTRYEADGQLKALDPVHKPNMLYFGVLVGGLLLTLLLVLVAAPRIQARDNLALWHGVGTFLYVAQWLCALIAVIRLQQRRT